MKGFKNFLMRGDVIVVAVGLVVALAFSGLITAFTNDIITPLVQSFQGGKVGLGVYGVSNAEAVTWVIGFHLLTFIPITILGVWYLTRMKLSLRDLRSVTNAPPPK